MHESSPHESSPHESARTASASPLSIALAALAVLVIAGLVCARLSAYGIWDPWELAVADAARKVGKGVEILEPARALLLGMIRASFNTFGTREWAGRLPMAACGLSLLALTWLWGRRLGNGTIGTMAVLVLGTTPLFLLQSRQMSGGTPTFLASTGVMLGASVASFASEETFTRAAHRWLWLAFAVASGCVGLYVGGALITIVPPLAAVAVVFLLLHGSGVALPSAQRISGLLSVVAGFGLTLAVAGAVWQHAGSAGLLIGAAPLEDAPPTFERVIEHLFHGFAPWSALLPVALGQLLRVDDKITPRVALGLCAGLWAILAYGAQTLTLSSYGSAPFTAPVALAVAAAIWLDETSRGDRTCWPESLVILLLVGLLIRDFALYPASPLGVLELNNVKLPDTFNPKREWAALLGAFAGAVALFCIATKVRDGLDLKAPYRGLVNTWRLSISHKLWLTVAALALLGMLGFSAAAWIAPDALRLTSIARRVGLVLGAVALGIPVAIALVQIVDQYASKLASLRTMPMFAAALALGGYTSQGFLPAVSEQFSPRGVFDAYNRHSKPGEPLAQHKVEGRAAAYYAHGTVKDIANRQDLVEFLSRSGRRWAAFPSEDLPDIDLAFRKITQRHLFVASEATSRVALTASMPVAGATDYSPLTRFVLKNAPKVQHEVHGMFESSVELVGYDLKLPGKDHVGAGQSFEVTWYWRVLKANLGSYKIFVHLDGQDQRLNGDHEGVDGGYPVRLWDLGDVIVDRQELSVPATYPSGVYTLYVGFFRGESRLKVVQGPKDETSRLRAGTVRIR